MTAARDSLWRSPVRFAVPMAMKPKMSARSAGSQHRKTPAKGISDKAAPTIPVTSPVIASPLLVCRRSLDLHLLNLALTVVGHRASLSDSMPARHPRPGAFHVAGRRWHQPPSASHRRRTPLTRYGPLLPPAPNESCCRYLTRSMTEVRDCVTMLGSQRRTILNGSLPPAVRVACPSRQSKC